MEATVMPIVHVISYQRPFIDETVNWEIYIIIFL